ncbi:flagellin [Clostridium sp. SHJSY1]|uniref:flagellin n=1 Tax=Clostridium sp. SHJSY1 TaxID=2942483 RepID=UPI00287B70D7|nr:flagellin [Clostridium sp. SHJSY1]
MTIYKNESKRWGDDMRLNHNINSLTLFNKYKKNLVNNEKAINRISSGVKINSAKDNPNKIGQSESMRIQIKSLEAAQKNLQDGASMIQAADGALQELNNTLSRMKELAVSSANGSNSPEDRNAIQIELDQMKKNINDIANNTEFNGIKLIGNKDVFENQFPVYNEIMAGALPEDIQRIPAFNVSTEILGDKDGNKIKDIDLSNEEGAQKAIATINDVVETVVGIRAQYGAIQNKYESSADRLSSNTITVEKAYSNLKDADIGKEMAELARTQILNQTGIALIAQSNKFPQDALSVLRRV